MNDETVLQPEKDLLRENLTKYTRRAFHMLPALDKPRILDIGCGSGIPTVELARLSNGRIVALDINQDLLDILTRKSEEAVLSDRVKPVNCSMSDMDFPDESFDVIWAEGSISAIGFEKGLREWRRFIKPNGFLVVHDEMGNLTRKLEQISSCGYDLLCYLTLGEDTWWAEYYAPLEKRICEIQTKHAHDYKLPALLDQEKREIDMFKSNPKRYRSTFFVMQKMTGA